MSFSESELDTFKADTARKTLQVERTDINRSLSSLSNTGISLDHLLRKCGDLGRFQLIHFFFINFVAMSAGVVSFYYVFGAAEPHHRCRLPADRWADDTSYNPINQTHRLLIDSYIPRTTDGDKWERCLRYTTDSRNQTLVQCPNGWVYDRSVFGYTFTEEANLVCQHESKKSWLATLLQCGGFSLLVIGSLADRYGRKKITVIVNVLLFSTCLLSQIIIQWLPMTVQTKFFLLLINQFASGLAVSTYSLVFILMLELTSATYTSLAANLAFISFSAGEVIVSLFAYSTRDWQKLKWADTAFIGLGIPYLYFMPESPLYTYSKGQYSQLEAILRRIATQNGRQEADWYSCYQDLLRKRPMKLSESQQSTFPQKIYRLLSHRPTIIKLWITGLLGFTILLVYIKISYGLAMMNVSPYLAILIGAVVEAAGYTTSSFLISTKLGRKGSFALMISLTILCVLLLPIIVKYSTVATVFVAQFGKYAISGAIGVSWIFVPELFPTSIRSSANGFFVASSRVGAIMGPIIDASISKEHLPYTFYASAVLATVVLLLSLFLPETKDKPMDDAQDYVSNVTEF